MQSLANRMPTVPLLFRAQSKLMATAQIPLVRKQAFYTPLAQSISNCQLMPGFTDYCSTGAGSQKFSVVNVEDAAAAYVSAATSSAAPGIYHIAGEQGITALELATAISKKLSLPVSSMSHEEAKNVYKALYHIYSISNDVDSSKARRELSWHPKHTKGFLHTVSSS